MTRIGILGGTFDPIHNGHLDVARAAANALHLSQVRLLPSHVPPHRQAPGTRATHRFAMVALAAQEDPRFIADDTELLRDGPSYAADTLRHLHQSGFQPQQLFFLTGVDAFAEVATWRGYPALLNLAHFVVCSRAGREAGVVRGLLPALQDRTVDAAVFSRQPASAQASAKVILLHAGTTDVSSTDIRAALASGDTDLALRGLLPPAVFEHVRRHGLYNVVREP